LCIIPYFGKTVPLGEWVFFVVQNYYKYFYCKFGAKDYYQQGGVEKWKLKIEN
jgi:hypothetical protein